MGSPTSVREILPEYSRSLQSPLWRGWRLTLALSYLGFCLIIGAAFAFVAPALIALFAIPILMLAMIAIWALPELKAVPSRTMGRLFFVYLATLVLWPKYLALALPGLPWITLVRLSSFPMALLLLICVAASAEFRSKLATSVNSTPLLWKLLVGFVGIQTLSIGLSKFAGYSADKYVEAQVTWTAIFFVSAYLFIQPKLIEKCAMLLWVMAVIVSALGLWEFKLKHVPWAGHIPSFLKIDDPHITHILAGVFRDDGQYRIASTFSTSLGFGEYIALTLPFVLQFVVNTSKWSVRIAGVASAALLIGLAVLSGTRLAVIGCFLTLLFYLLLIGVQRWRRRKDSLIGPAIALAYPVIFAGGVASAFFVGRVRKIFFGDGAAISSTSDRIAQYQLGLPKIMEHPLGYGAGMGAQTLGYQPYGFLTIDTYYLAIALEYGVIGFVVYYSMFFVAIYEAGRRALFNQDNGGDQAFLAPLAMSLFNFVVIKSVFSEPDNHPLVFMMLGMVVALVARAKPEAASPASRSGSRVRT
jgi:O-Antigen ligase